MNRRLLFLSSHLSGILIGAALAWIYFPNTLAKAPAVSPIPRNPVVVPVSYPSFPHASPFPDGWELRYFNGQPYYIIPIETEVTHTTI